jgi:protein-S-isoprenylcysteine O-methyltransferase Ste14
MNLSMILGLSYFASEALLGITRRSRSKTGEKQDQSTLLALWIVIVVSVTAGIFVAKRFRAGDLPHGRAFAVLGVIVFAIGLALRWWAIVTLGRFFTVDVTIARDHELVERGPFRVIRHPTYTGALLAFLGWALTLENWLAALVVLVPIVAVFVSRMNVEEQALESALGQRYVDYMRRTKRLVPGFY